MPKSECKQKSVEDELELVLPWQVNHSPKQQNVSKAITVHSSLAAISTVCKEVTDMDLQTGPKPSQTYQKQQSGLRIPPIWVPTPKTGVPIHTPIERKGTVTAKADDRMLHPKIFKQIQKLSNHSFTLDACTNRKGDNVLCGMILLSRGLVPR